jgi:hypothetical protein
MDRRFTEALFNTRHKVLGRKLHDFCLSDVILLETEENFFSRGEGIPTWADLAVAVRICSTPSKKFTKVPGILGIIWRVLRDYSWAWWIRRRYNFDKELAKFVEYQRDFDSAPEFWENDETSSLKAPWAFSVACFIESHSNMTFDEILRAPIGLMIWKSAALGEIHGATKSDIMTEIEQEAVEIAVKNRKAEEAKKKEAEQQ